MNNAGQALLAVALAVIGLATLAVILSSKAQTSSVIQAGGTALGTVITDAVAPVTSSTNTGLGLL